MSRYDPVAGNTDRRADRWADLSSLTPMRRGPGSSAPIVGDRRLGETMRAAQGRVLDAVSRAHATAAESGAGASPRTATSMVTNSAMATED